MTEAQLQQQEREKAQLQMLIGDRETSKKVDPAASKSDPRFSGKGDGDYAVDPTHREYRKVV